MVIGTALARAKGILIDLDGSFLEGTALAPGALELFESYADRIVFVSNNSSHTPEEMSAELAVAGIKVEPSRIFLAGHSAGAYIAMMLVADRLYAKKAKADPNVAGVIGIAGIDNDLRPGVLSITHGFGRNPGEVSDPRRDGMNVNRLLHWEDDADPYHGMPRMGALPISVQRISSA